MQTKTRNVKRKNAQTGKGANVIAYKFLSNKYFMSARINKKEAIFSNT